MRVSEREIIVGDRASSVVTSSFDCVLSCDARDWNLERGLPEGRMDGEWVAFFYVHPRIFPLQLFMCCDHFLC